MKSRKIRRVVIRVFDDESALVTFYRVSRWSEGKTYSLRTVDAIYRLDDRIRSILNGNLYQVVDVGIYPHAHKCVIEPKPDTVSRNEYERIAGIGIEYVREAYNRTEYGDTEDILDDLNELRAALGLEPFDPDAFYRELYGDED